MKKKRSRAKPSRPTVVLDSFTHHELNEWLNRGDEVQSISDRVYFDLERQRAAKYDDLCSSLRGYPGTSIDVSGWTRVVDWRWSLSPLSGAGSLKGIGGRFNIGEDLDRARGQAFRALYIAQDIETAYSERFGGALSSKGRLSLGEFALRTESSFTTFLLSGQVEQVLDLRTATAIEAFTSIIKEFDLAPATKAANRRARVQSRFAITTAAALRKMLLQPPSHWRLEPQAFGIPATCQIFGRFARDAGFEGILFPSQAGPGHNLALYPDNFQGSTSKIAVIGEVPDGATHTILDANHF